MMERSFLKVWLLVPLVFLASSSASSFSTLLQMSKHVVVSASTSELKTSLIGLRGGTSDENQSVQGDEEAPPPPSPPSPPAVPQEVELKEVVAVEEATINPTTNLMGPNAAPPGFLRKGFSTLAWHRLPDILTYMRCVAIPLLVWLFYMPGRHVETSVLFGFASFTDWLDGYLARRWDITSPFGAFLDPVADKLMVSTALILLTGHFGKLVAIPTCIILAREIAVSALREWMAQRGSRDSVKVGFQGKLKTAATMASLTLLLLVDSVDSRLYMPSLALLYLCSLVTVTSGSVYFRAAAPVLLESK